MASSSRANSVVTNTSSATIVSEGFDTISKVNQYLFLRKLGEGSSAVVFECENENDANLEHVAMKCFPSNSILKRRTTESTKVGRKMITQSQFDELLKEIAIMKKINHPNVVRLFEIIDDEKIGRIFMVMELVEGGCVMNWNTNTQRFSPNPLLTSHPVLPIPECKFVMRDILCGLDYLHQLHIVHRDIKPENLLFHPHTHAVLIADFGTSLFLEDDALVRSRGTVPFYAPECCSQTKFDGFKADLWALGVCMFAFMTGELPFYSESEMLLMDMIKTGDVPFHKVSNRSKEEIEVLHLLLNKQASTRLENANAVIQTNPRYWNILAQEESVRDLQDQITPEEISNALTVTLLVHEIARHWRRKTLHAKQRKTMEEDAFGTENSLLETPNNAVETQHHVEEGKPPQPTLETDHTNKVECGVGHEAKLQTAELSVLIEERYLTEDAEKIPLTANKKASCCLIM